MEEHTLMDETLWRRLGFVGQDVADVLSAAAAVVDGDGDSSSPARERVRRLVTRLEGIVGEFSEHDVFGDMHAEALVVEGVDGNGWGVIGILALAAAVPEVRRFHQSRGIPDDVSWASLADLGEKVRIHRETYGEFGLHALSWLTTAWSGALYSLGRLQFNLHRYEPEASDERAVVDPTPRWVLSTHIPATGPLDPEACDESFARAGEFFDRHFPEYGTKEFHCNSWLLDPRLAQLPAGSNAARFQARWTLDGPGSEANPDAYFFIWGRRGDVDPAALPADSSLRWLVRSEILAGRPWLFQPGLIPRR